MTTLKSVPGQPEISIRYLDESLKFIGHNVSSIQVNNVEYGCTLMLDELIRSKITIRKLVRYYRSTRSQNRLSGLRAI